MQIKDIDTSEMDFITDSDTMEKIAAFLIEFCSIPEHILETFSGYAIPRPIDLYVQSTVYGFYGLPTREAEIIRII